MIPLHSALYVRFGFSAAAPDALRSLPDFASGQSCRDDHCLKIFFFAAYREQERSLVAVSDRAAQFWDDGRPGKVCAIEQKVKPLSVFCLLPTACYFSRLRLRNRLRSRE